MTGTYEYTSTPTHLRIFTDGMEWFIDGADRDNNYTEGCWSFDTFTEAVAALPEFVELHDDVTWDWRTAR